MLLSPQASAVAAQLVTQIAQVRQDRKVFMLALRAVAELFSCEGGSVFIYRRATGRLHKVKSLTEGENWDTEVVASFYRNEKPRLLPDRVMAPVRIGSAVVGVMTLKKEGGLHPGVGKTVTQILKLVGTHLGLRQELACLGAESAVARAIIGGLNPKDTVYRILHQLRRFIDYDHGATLLLKTGERSCRVLARQVAWSKGKSDMVGLKLPFAWPAGPDAAVGAIVNGSSGAIWEPVSALREQAAPGLGSALIGWLTGPSALGGCVCLASRRPEFFVDMDVRVLSRFLPYLAWCLVHGDEDWRSS